MLLVLIVVILAFAQITLLPHMVAGALGFNALLAFIIALSMYREGREALDLAFVGGGILSLYSGIHFGFLPLFFVLIAFFSSLSTGDIFKSNYVMIGIFGFLWSALFEILVMFSMLLAGYSFTIFRYTLKVVMPRALLDAGLVLLLTVFLQRFGLWLFREKQR